MRNEAEYRRKGWIMVHADLKELAVELAFLALVPLGATQLPIVVPTIRLEYDNYDLWPPSLTFIDLFSGRPVRSPLAQAYLITAPGDVRNVLMTNKAGKQFLCLPGTREYHEHPDHDGDIWALHRPTRAGAIAVVCDRVWTTMTSGVSGIGFQIQPVLAAASPTIPVQQAQEAARQARAAYELQLDGWARELDSESG